MTSSIRQIGDLIEDQYRILECRHGGMGNVYIVRDEATSKLFALKSLRYFDEEDAEISQRFHREAKIWVNLGYHTEIVQAYAFLDRKTEPLLLLEFVDGPSLKDVLRIARHLPPIQVINWGLQIAAGMQHLHTCQFPDGQHGTIHRDLKPGNLLITRKNQLKITDFGLSKLHDQCSTVNGRFLGTLAYSSPEQLQNAKHVDHRTDIFSFGIILYEALAGVRPFDGENALELSNNVTYAEPDLEVLPISLRDLIAQCLQKSPQDRFQSFAAVQVALNDLKQTIRPLSTEVTCERCSFVSFGTDQCLVCDEPSHYAAITDVLEVSQATIVMCEYCGGSNDLTNNFCNDCGSRLSQRAK